jgi:lysophospholipase L1-like esterase
VDERVLVCFGDSNTHGSVPSAGPGGGRFGPGERWTRRLAATLGPAWRVHEEGLPGRTTVHRDPVEGLHLSGRDALPMVLGTHSPIDVLVLMLGTNDLKARFAVGALDIATSVEVLLNTARGFCTDTGRPLPRILVVAPPPIAETGPFAETFAGGAAKSRRFAALFAEVADRAGAAFLDAGAHVRVSAVDGIHFDADQQPALAAAVARAVTGLVPASGQE